MTKQEEMSVHRCECEICKTGRDPETVRSHHRINLFLSRLNEPQRRWYVGLLSQEVDRPSDRQLSLITGLDEKTIRRGRNELERELVDLPLNRQRQERGGRWSAEKKTRP